MRNRIYSDEGGEYFKQGSGYLNQWLTWLVDPSDNILNLNLFFNTCQPSDTCIFHATNISTINLRISTLKTLQFPFLLVLSSSDLLKCTSYPFLHNKLS